MTDISNGNLNLETQNQPVVVLPKVMSAKTFNRIYGGHEEELHNSLSTDVSYPL